MSELSSLSERFSLDRVITGLADDLDALRAGAISVDDARARAELAKQILAGVRAVMRGQQMLAAGARALPGGDA